MTTKLTSEKKPKRPEEHVINLLEIGDWFTLPEEPEVLYVSIGTRIISGVRTAALKLGEGTIKSFSNDTMVRPIQEAEISYNHPYS